MGVRRSPESWPLVGREVELTVISQVLDVRDPGGIVVVGPAGQGKTRLGRECLRMAEDRGFATASAVASRAAATIPLGALAPLLPAATERPTRGLDLIRGAVRAIADAAVKDRLAVFVDDAHLLDPASATVLQQLAGRRHGVSVVVTVRSGEPCPDPIEGLWKDGLAERIDLGALSADEVDQLATAIVEGPLNAGSLQELRRATQGNPLLVRELVLGALDAGYLREEEGVWRFTRRPTSSPRLADLVGARLAHVNAEERAALELLAVGGPLGLALLARLVTPDVLETLETKGLVVADEDRQRRPVRLSHPIYADVVRDAMTAIREMAVSRALADAVEGCGARRREDPLRVASWQLAGGGELRPELMLHAARQAHFLFDDALAVRLAEAAHYAGGGVDAGLLRAEILTALGRHDEAAVLLAGLSADAATDQQRGAVALGHAITLFWGLGHQDEAHAVLRDAREKIGDVEWRDELIAQQATFHSLGGDPRRALELADPLLDGHGRPAVVAAIAAEPALAVSGQCERAIEIADRALTTHVLLDNQEALSHPGIHVMARALALIESGRLGEADITLTAARDAVLHMNHSLGQAWVALMCGRTAMLQGRLVAAARSFGEGAALFRACGQDGPRRWCLAGRIICAAMAGQVRPAIATLDTLDAVPPTPMLMMEPDVDRARAWARAVAGDVRRAQVLLRSAAVRASESGAHALATGALHDLARLGAADEALPCLAVESAHVDGQLAATRAAHAAALAVADGPALDEAATRFETMGTILFAAEAAAAAAAAHRRAGAGRIARRSASRSAALAARCEAARTPALALAGPSGTLTPREREIAVLAATGTPNREIGERLDLSVRTVENHLGRVYVKLGVVSRAELAALLDVSTE